MNDKESDNLKRKVTKKDIIQSIIAIFLMLTPALLRDLYPNHPIIQGLFGGVKLVIYWGVIIYSIYFGWKIKLRLKKNEERKHRNAK